MVEVIWLIFHVVVVVPIAVMADEVVNVDEYDADDDVIVICIGKFCLQLLCLILHKY